MSGISAANGRPTPPSVAFEPVAASATSCLFFAWRWAASCPPVAEDEDGIEASPWLTRKAVGARRTSELKAAGYSASDLKEGGYSESELKPAGYSASELTWAFDLRDTPYIPR